MKIYINLCAHWFRKTFFGWSMEPTPESIRAKLEKHVASLRAKARQSEASIQIHIANHEATVAELRVFSEALDKWRNPEN